MSLGGKLAEKLGWRRPPLAPDAAAIRTLAGLLSETGLSEIEYAVGDHRIRVAREPAGGVVSVTNGHAPAPLADPKPNAPAVSEIAATALTAAASPADLPGAVTSPIVGIAYIAPEPGAPPFVRVGDSVSEGQTLLIIEAMKVMNQIRAPRAGRVTQIFAEDGEPVEYGAALMLIE
ncbi:MAG: acetyl-CoA carboxylase biotin carboxyl carrier protein [Stellaceae bacterium]